MKFVRVALVFQNLMKFDDVQDACIGMIGVQYQKQYTPFHLVMKEVSSTLSM